MRWRRQRPSEIRAAQDEERAQKMRQRAAVEDAVCALFGRQCSRVEAHFDPRVGGHYLTVSYQNGTQFDWFQHLPGRRYDHR